MLLPFSEFPFLITVDGFRLLSLAQFIKMHFISLLIAVPFSRRTWITTAKRHRMDIPSRYRRRMAIPSLITDWRSIVFISEDSSPSFCGGGKKIMLNWKLDDPENHRKVLISSTCWPVDGGDICAILNKRFSDPEIKELCPNV